MNVMIRRPELMHSSDEPVTPGDNTSLGVVALGR
jgi:hypothetical protein